MNWKAATRAQLLLICSDYENCPIHLKLEAAAELKRRKRETYQRVQYKKKSVYQR